MRQLILAVHISLDGYVAGPRGELDGFPTGEENLQFVCNLTRHADAALMGRVSFQLLNSYWPGAKDLPGATAAQVAYSIWYNQSEKFVVSTTLKNDAANKTIVISSDPANHVKNIRQQPGKNIIIFGSPTIAHILMRENLIDTWWIFINPVLFGKGIPLFRQLERTHMLKLKDKITFANGEVAFQYVNV